MSSIQSSSKVITGEQPVVSEAPETAGLEENNNKRDANIDGTESSKIENSYDTSLKFVNGKNTSENLNKLSADYTSNSDESDFHAIDNSNDMKIEPITYQDKRQQFQPLRKGQDYPNFKDTSLEPSIIASGGKYKKPVIPSPLNLPKRFIKPHLPPQNLNISASNNSTLSSSKGSPAQREVNSKDATVTSPKLSPTSNSMDKNLYYQPLPTQQVQQIQQMQLYPSYQQLYYNTQTGQIVYMPVAAPAVPFVQQISQQHLPQPLVVPSQQRQGNPVLLINQQLQQQLQQQQQQIVYLKGINGQLVPLLTPSPSYNINKPQSRAGSPLNINKRNDSISPSGNDSKRQKSSTDSKLNFTQEAQRLQKQQIQLQTQMHPNLSSEFETTNISDVFVDNLNAIDSNSNVITNDDNLNDDSNEKIDDVEAQLLDSADSSHSLQEKKPPLQKVIGTLTLGSFTYRYSQTLSGNITKDKELFDRLADNAWKACISKR
ncbi:hypothetical protein CANINC_001006 [Pichia inconspicua]|uniref:Uncharacterized protein n=1 Tax=Pichia inconspicua TaxID=52247 RepID=A0A4T0X534_9ASCO|nr:hypothetical protein CANINC_001006 [[Candida] inconspicua]